MGSMTPRPRVLCHWDWDLLCRLAMLNWLTSREPGGEQQVARARDEPAFGRGCSVRRTRAGREPPSRPPYRPINL